MGLSAAILVACGGCDLLPLATLGAAFDIAGTAVSTGAKSIRPGTWTRRYRPTPAIAAGPSAGPRSISNSKSSTTATVRGPAEVGFRASGRPQIKNRNQRRAAFGDALLVPRERGAIRLGADGETGDANNPIAPSALRHRTQP